MQLTYLRLLLWSWLLLLSGQIWAQTELWSPIAEDQIPESGTRYIFAEQYQTLRLDLEKIRAILEATPMERTPIAAISPSLLSLPLPDGSHETFEIVESPIMEVELAEKFPEIQTYSGRGVNDPSKSVRFDLTPQGFHAMILTAGEGTVYIDPYQFGGGDIEHYIVYNRRDFRPASPKQFVCGLMGNDIPLSNFKAEGQTAARFGSCELRTYRIAIAATGEYTQFHGGTVALALAAQTTTLNRVNGVYEREMAIRMSLVANNNLIIYTNATTDPYTNGSPGAMITENQTNIDTEIGSANYDIGHVFGTNSGGLAGLGVVCNNFGKARGVTGSGAPIGDPFDIDYVAHEVGHQFGCNHTQNNGCNRNNATAMEPGSASTIMGYAGICAPNVQNRSDDYFHSISLEEMGAFITRAGHNCPATTALANNAPTVNAPAANITIPASTPFSLTATANDPDGNTLTYSWEQMENTAATMPPVASSTAGPNFRSFDPVTNPTRYFPNLSDLAAGGPFTWEVLPAVSRSMDFRVTVRDNAVGGGCTDHADMQVTVDANSGPFVVLYPSITGISWNGGSTETVTWDVAGTDGSPVSCANVDILLSTDGGLTYPTVLASNVTNDGSEVINVPNIATTTGRIMVRCANGYFFDISDQNFTIVLATTDYTLSTTNNSQIACAPSTLNYTIDIGQIGGYTDPVALTVTGLPTGVSASFSSNSVTPVGSAMLNLTVAGSTTAGSYPITVNASSTSGNKSLALTLVVNHPTATTNSTAASCNGGADGSATAIGSAGTAPYSFVWSNGQTSATISGLLAGTYTVTVTDAGGCAAVATVVVNEPTVLAATTASTDESCTGADGRATVTASGGTAGYSFLWSNGQTTATANNLVGGTYTVTITDANGCTAVATAVVGNSCTSCTLAATTNNTAASCNGGADGSATAIGSAGTAPYSFVWSNGQTSATISGLLAGTYTVTVTDAGGCAAVATAVVNEPTVLAATTASTDESCTGADGRATVTASGGTAGYSFLWSNGQTTATANNLVGGTYTVTITDANGCTAVATVVVGYNCPCNGSLQLNPTAVSCASDCDGSISLQTNGLQAPISYRWTSGAIVANPINLCAGNYSVTATDANGCVAIASTNIAQPTAMTLATGINDESCAGNDGDLTAIVNGGTTPYSFVWSNAATSSSQTGLSAGAYQLTVSDANGCELAAVYTVSLANSLATNAVASQNASCAGYADGEAQAVGTGTGLPMSYSWSNGANTQTANGLMAGSYTVTISSGVCSAQRTVQVGEPAAMQIQLLSSEQNCVPGTGELALNVHAGAGAPYSYLWSNGATSASINNLVNGTYTVTITDANGCEEQRSASFNIPQGPRLTAVSNSPNCSNTADGSLNLSVSPAGNYLYSWSNGANTEDLQGLSGGVYTVSVTDTALGCIVVLRDTVNAPASLQVAFSLTQPHTPASGDGALAASENGGTAPFSYLWSTGDSVQQLTNVGIGSYSVTITDANGCMISDSIQVTATTGLNTAWVEAFSLFPNPNNGQMQLHLFLTKTSEAELAIFDVLGRELHQQSLKGQRFELPLAFDWPAGTYFLRLSTKQGQITQKFVIRR